MTRVAVVLIALCCTLAEPQGKTVAQDVPWLSKVNEPPSVVPAQSPGAMSELLVTEKGDKITSIAEWEEKRKVLRQQWLEFLGPMPADRPAVQIELLSSEFVGEVTRQLIRYECERNLFVEAYLLLPAKHEGNRKSFGLNLLTLASLRCIRRPMLPLTRSLVSVVAIICIRDSSWLRPDTW